MNLENFAKMRGLQMGHESYNTFLLDHVLSSDQGDEIREKVLTKRLQFDTTPVVYSKVENVCNLLKCSKREFMEMAILEAVEKAELIFGEAFKEATGQEISEVYGVKEES